ncbi:tetratricopeptide repeat protein [Oceanobacillus sp. 1P07AA]|uniref:tetratricopeptide repeat protein n=1 Tax=Oceanobacillus sp. 1P07AA TaxID=3132293 RepID=UPI0039A780EA
MANTDTNVVKIAQLKTLVLNEELEKSIAFAEREINSQPDNSIGYVLKALHHYYINEQKEALSWANQAYELAPESEDVLTVVLAFYHETELQPEKWKNLTKTAVQLYPNNDYFHFMHALIHLNVDFEQSKKSYQEAIRLNPNNANYLAHYAYMLYFLKEKKEAKKYEKAALQKEPNNPAILNRFALTAYDQRKYKKAQILITKARQLDPKNEVIRTSFKKIHPTENGVVRGKREINNAIQNAFAAPGVWIWRNVFRENVSAMLVTFLVFVTEFVLLGLLTGRYGLALVVIYLIWGYISQQITRAKLQKAGFTGGELTLLWGRARTQSNIFADNEAKLQPKLPSTDLEKVLVHLWNSDSDTNVINLDVIAIDTAPKESISTSLDGDQEVAATTTTPSSEKGYAPWPTVVLILLFIAAIAIQFGTMY